MKYRSGFTILELMFTITIMAILVTVTAVPAFGALPRSRDTERFNDIASIARRLEQAYAAQEVGQPAYPTTTKLLADISSNSGTVSRLDPSILSAPDAGGSSVVAATSNSLTAPKGTGSPVLNEYVYQPLTDSGALCTGTSTCIRFFLYYRTEEGNEIKITKSIHQQ